MTALKKYQRLESPGLWRESPDAQRRDVVVAFREATLVLFDPRTETPLSHWSLPAIERANPGVLPAIFVPAPEDAESLEIEDTVMIEAIEQIRSAVNRGKSRPGRLRGSLLGGGMLAVLAVGLFFLPDALTRHTATVLPTATRLAIGTAALADVTRLTGTPCATPLGARGLGLLSERLFGAGGPTILVLRDGLAAPAHLPGRFTLLPRALVETAAAPEVLAGYVLAETERARAADPTLAFLDHAGMMATIRLLATGSLPDGVAEGYGEALLRAAPLPLADETLLAAFAQAEVASTAYAFALDPTGETTLTLIEADPFRGESPRPLLEPADWDAIRTICAG
ncbi:MAG: hypothetical protein RIR62_1737 [Pseudomonadota bacterium]|jgi:hypothetical protein